MTRPNRYPYTRSQWEEETTLVCFGNDDRLELKVERNKITKESRQCHSVEDFDPDSMVMEAGVIDVSVLSGNGITLANKETTISTNLPMKGFRKMKNILFSNGGN